MNDVDLDRDVLLTINYGLYIVSSCKTGCLNGQISNAIMQVTDRPPRLAAAINKGSLTHECISDTGTFAITVLSQSAPRKLIGLFGFHSGRDTDKLSQVSWQAGVTGSPIVRDHALAYMEVRVQQSLDCGTHTVFVGEVVAGRIIGRGTPMTYAYYREVLGGKTPPTAPSYRTPDTTETESAGGKKTKENATMKKYICDVCGYVYDPDVGDPDNGIKAGTAFEDLPDDWLCPECGAGKDEFSPAE